MRQAIAEHYKRWYNIEVPATNVAVTTGSSGAFMLLFLAAFNAGDKVALARPLPYLVPAEKGKKGETHHSHSGKAGKG